MRRIVLMWAALSAVALAQTPVVTPDRIASTVAELTALLADPTAATIWLKPGDYPGNFVIKRPVRLESLCACGLTPGVRVTPADVQCARLVASDRFRPVLVVQGAAASGTTVHGLTLVGGNVDRDTVNVGSNTATTLAQQPSNITFDQVAVLADPAGGHRGIGAHVNGGFTLTNSYVGGYVERYRDSQALWINNGTGPYLIENNFLEGSGENILIGGDTVRIPNLVPENITIRKNWIYKPDGWRALPGSVKNSFELKCARKVLFEDNLVDGNWRDAQSGHTVVLTVRNQYGNSPWCIVDEVVVRGNRLRRTTDGYAINILGSDNNYPSQQTQQITIERNYFEDARAGIMVQHGVCNRLTVTDNTAPAIKGSFLYYSGLLNGLPRGCPTPTTLERNVFTSGAYGIFGAGSVAPGTSTLTFWTGKNYGMIGNVIEKSAQRPIAYPPNNTLMAVGTLAATLDPDGHYLPGGAGW